MSGGVDSSVAAALLKKRGFNVVGVFMKPWSRSVSSNSSTSRSRILDSQSESGQPPCLWQRDREDAMRVATKLGIPLLTWDFSKEYKKEVTDYMIREYRAGRTPNPDVMCNKHIKFGLFLGKALKEGADYITTGHYVRITKHKARNMKHNGNASSFTLYASQDKNKDQSYFLWTLTQEQLKYCLFPIGDYTKLEVRRMAKKFGLPTAEKKDSQGVCFIGPLDMKGFLQKYIKPKTGILYHTDGRLLGAHDGVFYYTIGQRHGLDIKNGQGPYYVVRKDIKNNIIFVGSKKELGGQTVKVNKVNWLTSKLKLPARIQVKIRYRSRSIPTVISSDRADQYSLLATRYSLQSITPGQSAVFYKGNELLGGGIIM